MKQNRHTMKIAIAVHGGARACQRGHDILKGGGSALDAVEEAVKILEDSPYFNAGRGSALNCCGEVEMDAAIMDGKELKAGAVSMIKQVKNPISLARLVMTKTKHVFLSGYGALEFAGKENVNLKPESYFITNHQYDEYERLNAEQTYEELLNKKKTGTVGAVALDLEGNLAAGTSTGGTSNCLPGRIGDSCIIGAGCYANNKSCAVSGTGEGEYLITGVIAHTISMMTELNIPLQEICNQVLYERNKNRGEIGVISVNHQGNIGISFNTEIMKRAWIGLDSKLHVKIN
jgi:L-asparaginase / beta-aspartyl-peptidase